MEPAAQLGQQQLMPLLDHLAQGIILLTLNGDMLWANEAALRFHATRDKAKVASAATGYLARFALPAGTSNCAPQGYERQDCIVKSDGLTFINIELRHVHSQPQRHYLQIRCSALLCADKARHCLALVIDDVTTQISANQQFGRVFDALPVPAVVCRLADLHFVRANNSFTAMTGYAEHDVINHSIYEIDVLAGAPDKDGAIQCLRTHTGIPRMETVIPTPGAGAGCRARVSGQPIRVDGDPCMLFTFTDLSVRSKVSKALRQSEERFAGRLASAVSAP